MSDNTTVQNRVSLKAETLSDRSIRILFGGDWTLETACSVEEVLELTSSANISSLKLESCNLGEWDSALLIAVIKFIKLAEKKHIPYATDTLPDGFLRLLNLALAVPANETARKEENNPGILEKIGNSARSIPSVCDNILNFIGEVSVAFGRFCVGRSTSRRRDILLYVQECGAEALPIVSLISLLVGFILAFVGIVQLGMFGAEIYVSSLVAIGMTRIMGAVMTGIIMAGRTGASFAAVLGTMQVNEEIDALSTQGLPPAEFLVLPRLIALTIMTPLLVLYSDFMGIIGGGLVGIVLLGLDPTEYLTFTKLGFGLSNLWVGLTHGFVFGAVIAVTGCYQGLRCGRSAAAVGNATTSAVVFSIVGIVISTALLTLMFNILEI